MDNKDIQTHLLQRYHTDVGADNHQADRWKRLGNDLERAGHLLEAIDCYERALRIEPQWAVLYSDLGNVLYRQGNLQAVVALYQQALTFHPHHTQIHLNLAIVLLTLGNYECGWKEYEWRLKTPAYLEEVSHRTLWQGEQITGKTLCVLTEQGVGDIIQFVRYLYALQDQSQAKLTIVCPASTLLLMQSSYPGYTWQTVLPDTADYVVYLTSLPWLLKLYEPLSIETPYLKIPPDSLKYWTQKLNAYKSGQKTTDAKHIGIVWSGNPDNWTNAQRSCPLAIFQQLFKIPNTQFYSLQLGDAAIELTSLPENNVIDLKDDINNYADTAAVIKNLDLIITIDTSVAHLAGALGRPVWILLPFVPDWRWTLSGEKTPWYPSARLFRQLSQGNWEEVINAIKLP